MTNSSPPDPASNQADRYRSPEYRALLGDPEAPVSLDPLVHPDPNDPPRLYRSIRRFLRWILPKVYRIRLSGLEHIPQPPYIIGANHLAWYDVAFIIPFFPESPVIYTMAKRETVFNRAWKRRLMRLIGVFPISPNRGQLDEVGLRTTYQVLERGGVVLMFPEGRYSRGRALRPLKEGIAHFALHAGVPICPVAVTGHDRLWPGRRIEISISPPVRPDPPAYWSLGQRVAQVADRVRLGILHALGRNRRT